jgi:hypothetical protein
MGLSKSQQITPKCCKKVQEKQTVFLSYDGYDSEDYEKLWCWEDGEEKKGPADRKNMYEKYKPLWVSGHRDLRSRCWGLTKIKFCPHCSRPVPEIKRRKTTRKIRSITDGGYYCDTCGERIMACQCYAPEYAWEPVGE